MLKHRSFAPVTGCRQRSRGQVMVHIIISTRSPSLSMGQTSLPTLGRLHPIKVLTLSMRLEVSSLPPNILRVWDIAADSILQVIERLMKVSFLEIYGNFIVKSDPNISSEIANGASSSNPARVNPASKWPSWNSGSPQLVNINQTGGTPYTTQLSIGATVTQFRGPGLRTNFTLADAYAWEGGRGKRCEFWKLLSAYVPQ
jgi:hypothetical protein